MNQERIGELADKVSDAVWEILSGEGLNERQLSLMAVTCKELFRANLTLVTKPTPPSTNNDMSGRVE